MISISSGWNLNALLCGHNPVTTLPFEGAVIQHECKVSSIAFRAVGPPGAFAVPEETVIWRKTNLNELSGKVWKRKGPLIG